MRDAIKRSVAQSIRSPIWGIARLLRTVPIPALSTWFLGSGSADPAGKWDDAAFWNMLPNWFLNGGATQGYGVWLDSMAWIPSFFLSTGTADLAGVWDDAQVWS